MKRSEHHIALDRDAVSNVWRNTLSQIPSVFGRMVYVSSLRNPNNGRYEHHGLALIYGEEDANKALRKSHLRIFNEWLTFNLQQQRQDLIEYVLDLPDDRATVIETWIKLSPYRNMVPGSVRGVERKLFIKDLTLLLELFKNAAGDAAPGPAA
jgi:hypothetical protein